LGGRIIQDKLFFFGGFQRSDIRQDPSWSTAFVPTAAALAGDFSALDGAGCQAKGVPRVVNDPTTGLPLPNFQISPTRFDPVSVALAKYLPQTSDPCGKVSYGIPIQSNESQIVGRVDWIINSKHSFSGRYFVDELHAQGVLRSARHSGDFGDGKCGARDYFRFRRHLHP
jgi:hypothetical protein